MVRTWSLKGKCDENAGFSPCITTNCGLLTHIYGSTYLYTYRSPRRCTVRWTSCIMHRCITLAQWTRGSPSPFVNRYYERVATLSLSLSLGICTPSIIPPPTRPLTIHHMTRWPTSSYTFGINGIFTPRDTINFAHAHNASILLCYLHINIHFSFCTFFQWFFMQKLKVYLAFSW